MSALDDAITQLASARLAYDTANTARYNAQVTADNAATALAAAQTNFDSVLANQLASINTPDVVAAAQNTGSPVSALLVTERNAGIQGAATLIKSNPACTTEEVAVVWTAAALAATKLPALLQDPNVLFSLYGTNLVNMKLIPDASWESIKQWVIATPIEAILAM